MSELLQSGQHPDADQLSAFIEQALPAHEYERTLAHLAICAECRAVVSLTSPPFQEHPLPQPVSARRPWFSGWNLAWPVAVAFAMLALFVVHVRDEHAGLNGFTKPTQTADLGVAEPPAAPAPPAPPTNFEAAAQPKPAIPYRAKANAGVMTRAASPTNFDVELGRGPVNRQIEVGGAGAGLSGGGIQGTVIDPSGARVGDAQIIATNTHTGVQTATKSNRAGIYSIQPLQPGPYNVAVTAKGFERLLQENVAVNNASVVGLDPKLRVGGANETVTVTDAPPLLATNNATLGSTVENQMYSQLPLSMNGGPRDPTAFQYVMPGAAANPAQGASKGTSGVQAMANGTTGARGDTGSTNLSENYVAGVPVAAAGQAMAAPPPPPPATIQTATAVNPPTVVSRKNAAEVDAVDQLSVGPEDNASAATISPNVTLAVTRARSAAHPLPSGLSVLSAAVEGHRMLAIDSAHAVFLSTDDGLHWLAIRSQWTGHAVKVGLALAQAPALGGAISGAAMAPLTAAPAAQATALVATATASPGARSTLSGVVTDANGAVVGSATVSVTNGAGATVRTVKTDATGNYLFENLPAGLYRIEATAPGFTQMQRNVALAASQRVSANLVLQIGAATETVTVTSESPQLRAAPLAKARTTPLASAVFEITTDSGEHWVSQDGQTWKLR